MSRDTEYLANQLQQHTTLTVPMPTSQKYQLQNWVHDFFNTTSFHNRSTEMHRCHTQRCPLYMGSSSEIIRMNLHIYLSQVHRAPSLWTVNKNNQEKGYNMYIIYMILRRQGTHISRLQYNLDTKKERQAVTSILLFSVF